MKFPKAGYKEKVPNACTRPCTHPWYLVPSTQYPVPIPWEFNRLRPSPRLSLASQVWDHAAGVLVVEEAGGVVSDAGGSPLNFGGGRFIEGALAKILAHFATRCRDSPHTLIQCLCICMCVSIGMLCIAMSPHSLREVALR